MQGCMDSEGFAVTEIDPAGWSEEVRVPYLNEDTVSMRSIDLFIIHDRRFPDPRFQTDILLTVMSPDSVSVTERVEVYPGGKARGNTSGYTEARFPYRRSVLLSQAGDYTFSFIHTAAVPIEGIKAVGVTISEGK